MKTNLTFPLRLTAAAVLALALSLQSGRGADANPPERMTYQGYVVDGNGDPLGNTGPKNYDVIFRIWNDQSASAAANELWAEQQTVTVDKGYFSVLLGEGSQYLTELHPPLSTVFTNSLDASDRFVELTVKGIGSGGTDATILPRLRLMSSPYAFLARYAVRAASLVNSTNGQVVSIAGGNVGINKAVPTSVLDVNGTVAATALAVSGNAAVGILSVAGDAAVAGTATAGALNVAAAARVASLTVTNAAAVGGALSAGSLAVNGPVTVSGAGSTVTAPGFVGNGTIPVGGIIMWSGASTTIPAGWALCDGGTHSGKVTPDLRGRFVLGTGVTFHPVGERSGEETHVLTAAEMPVHSHPFAVNTVGYAAAWNSSMEATAAPGQGRNNGWGTWTPGNAGSGAAHNNMPPYYALCFIMRVQ